MKIKKLAIFMVIVLVLIFTLEAAAQAKKINNIGQYTFARVRGKIPTPEVMKMLVDRYSADIKTGFDQAGYGGLYQSAENSPVRGHHLEHRGNGQVDAVPLPW